MPRATLIEMQGIPAYGGVARVAYCLNAFPYGYSGRISANFWWHRRHGAEGYWTASMTNLLVDCRGADVVMADHGPKDPYEGQPRADIMFAANYFYARRFQCLAVAVSVTRPHIFTDSNDPRVIVALEEKRPWRKQARLEKEAKFMSRHARYL